MPHPTRRRRTRTTAVLGLAALALAAAGCGSGASASAGATSAGGSGGTLVLYNAQHPQTTDALIAAFTRETGIKVKVDDDDEDVLTAQIEEEGSRSPADVFYTENGNWLTQLDQKGMLARVDAPTLANVPKVDSASSGDWVGVSARISCLVYNTQDLKPSELPTSVMQLADPTWKGKLDLAPSETDFWPIVVSVARAHGDAATVAWLKGLEANAGSDGNVPDNETITSDVSQDSAQIGVINHYYYYRLLAEVGRAGDHAGIAYFAPHDPGYLEDISGAGVLRSAPHPAAAQRFLAFITSSAGQSILARSDSFEYPIRPGVAANPQLKPLDQLQPEVFTPADLGTGLLAKTLLQRAGLL